MSWTYNGETIDDVTKFPPNTYWFRLYDNTQTHWEILYW